MGSQVKTSCKDTNALRKSQWRFPVRLGTVEIKSLKSAFTSRKLHLLVHWNWVEYLRNDIGKLAPSFQFCYTIVWRMYLIKPRCRLRKEHSLSYEKEFVLACWTVTMAGVWWMQCCAISLLYRCLTSSVIEGLFSFHISFHRQLPELPGCIWKRYTFLTECSMLNRQI